jgi:hypothetical protein
MYRYDLSGILKRKKTESVQHVKKNSVRIFVEKIYEMGFWEGSGVPVICIGRTVPKGSCAIPNLIKICLTVLLLYVNGWTDRH